MSVRGVLKMDKVVHVHVNAHLVFSDPHLQRLRVHVGGRG